MTNQDQPTAGVALKPGDLHTLMMDLIREDIVRQRPDAFTEDADFDLVIPSGCTPQSAYVKINVSDLADAILPHVSSAGSPGHIETAYRALWSHSTADKRLHEARRLLLDVLGGQGSEGQREALRAPTDAGGAVSEARQAAARLCGNARALERPEMIADADAVLAALTSAPPDPVAQPSEGVRESIASFVEERASQIEGRGDDQYSRGEARAFREAATVARTLPVQPSDLEAATWAPLDEDGNAEVRVNGKRITSMPSYDGAREVAERINAALEGTGR